MPYSKNNSQNRKKSVFVALFAALIAACGFISIPIPGSPVPIVIQNMMVVLTAILLGGLQGGGAVGLFLIAGTLGLPIFSGGSGGMSHLLGPTGGFLIGYFISALAAGFFIGKPRIDKKPSFFKIILASIIGYVLTYIVGIIHFMSVFEFSSLEQSASFAQKFGQTLSFCVIPFMPGLAVKFVLTIAIAYKLRPIVARYVFSDSTEIVEE